MPAVCDSFVSSVEIDVIHFLKLGGLLSFLLEKRYLLSFNAVFLQSEWY